MHIVVLDSFNLPQELIDTMVSRGYDISLLYSNQSYYYYGPASKMNTTSLFRKIEVEVFDYDSVKNELIQLNNTKNLDRIVCVSEYSLELCAKLSHYFSTPFTGIDTINLCRDKYRSRILLSEAGITNYAATICNFKELNDAIINAKLGSVIKPKSGIASEYVFIIKTEEDRASAINNIRQNSYQTNNMFSEDFLVEDYYDGSMYSVELAIDKHGTATRLGVGRRYRALHNEAVEVSTLVPANISPKTNEDIDTWLYKVSRTLNLSQGFYHIELVIKDKEINVIEINPRVAGGTIPKLISLAYDLNLWDLWCEIYIDNIKLTREMKTSNILCSYHFGSIENTTLKINESNSHIINDLLLNHHLNLKVDISNNMEIKKQESNHTSIGSFIVSENDYSSISTKINAILEKLEAYLGIQLNRTEMND